MIKHLKEEQLKFVSEGAFGRYYRIKNSNEGVKILYHYDYESILQAKESEAFKSAKDELKRLKQLRKKTALVPNAVSMAIVEMEHPWFQGQGRTIYQVGFIMSHVKGKPVGLSRMTSEDFRRFKAAERTLKRRGIYRNDCHDYNVIKTARGSRFNYIFIDPDALRFKKEVGYESYTR